MTMARNKFAFLAAGIVFAMTFALSCSEDSGSSGGENSSSSENNPSDNSSSSSLNSSSSLEALSSSSSEGGDASLDGTWQKVGMSVMFIIAGKEAIFKMNNENYSKGPVDYDGLSGSWIVNSIWLNEQWMTDTDPNSSNIKKMTFNYELNGNILTISGVLTISGATGEFDPFNGEWTRVSSNGNSSSSVGGGSSSSGGSNLSSSSGDNFSYLSCGELGSLMGGDPDAYVGNLDEACKEKPEVQQQYQQQCSNKPSAEIEACAGPIMMACMEKDENLKEACGGNSLEACRSHYAQACGIWN